MDKNRKLNFKTVNCSLIEPPSQFNSDWPQIAHEIYVFYETVFRSFMKHFMGPFNFLQKESTICEQAILFNCLYSGPVLYSTGFMWLVAVYV